MVDLERMQEEPVCNLGSSPSSGARRIRLRWTADDSRQVTDFWTSEARECARRLVSWIAVGAREYVWRRLRGS